MKCAVYKTHVRISHLPGSEGAPLVPPLQPQWPRRRRRRMKTQFMAGLLGLVSHSGSCSTQYDLDGVETNTNWTWINHCRQAQAIRPALITACCEAKRRYTINGEKEMQNCSPCSLFLSTEINPAALKPCGCCYTSLRISADLCCTIPEITHHPRGAFSCGQKKPLVAPLCQRCLSLGFFADFP